MDPEKVSFSIYTDNDQIFTFTPEMFPGQVSEPLTQFPYSNRTPNGNIGYWDIHFDDLTTMGDDPFFTWRIGLQTNYTDGGQTSSSDIMYREIYPQLQEAKDVTSTSFVADWSCDDPNTYTINNFIEDNTPDVGYNLYVVNMETQETIVVNKVNPTNWTQDEWGNNGTPLEEEAPEILVSPGILGEDIGGGGDVVECITPQATKDLLRIAKGFSYSPFLLSSLHFSRCPSPSVRGCSL